MEGIEINKQPYIIQDIATKKKYIVFSFPGMAQPDSIADCAIEITGLRKEIQLKNKKITVNLL